MNKEKVEAFDGVVDNEANDPDEDVEQQPLAYSNPDATGKTGAAAKQTDNANEENEHLQVDAPADHDEFKPSDVDNQYAQESGSNGEFCPSYNDRDVRSDVIVPTNQRADGNEQKSDMPPDDPDYHREDGPRDGADGDEG